MSSWREDQSHCKMNDFSPTSISRFSCSLVLNFFWTSLIRWKMLTRLLAAPEPRLELARYDLEQRQGRSVAIMCTCGGRGLHFFDKSGFRIGESHSIDPTQGTGEMVVVKQRRRRGRRRRRRRRGHLPARVKEVDSQVDILSLLTLADVLVVRRKTTPTNHTHQQVKHYPHFPHSDP